MMLNNAQKQARLRNSLGKILKAGMVLGVGVGGLKILKHKASQANTLNDPANLKELETMTLKRHGSQNSTDPFYYHITAARDAGDKPKLPSGDDLRTAFKEILMDVYMNHLGVSDEERDSFKNRLRSGNVEGLAMKGGTKFNDGLEDEQYNGIVTQLESISQTQYTPVTKKSKAEDIDNSDMFLQNTESDWYVDILKQKFENKLDYLYVDGDSPEWDSSKFASPIPLAVKMLEKPFLFMSNKDDTDKTKWLAEKCMLWKEFFAHHGVSHLLFPVYIDHHIQVNLMDDLAATVNDIYPVAPGHPTATVEARNELSALMKFSKAIGSIASGIKEHWEQQGQVYNVFGTQTGKKRPNAEKPTIEKVNWLQALIQTNADYFKFSDQGLTTEELNFKKIGEQQLWASEDDVRDSILFQMLEKFPTGVLRYDNREFWRTVNSGADYVKVMMALFPTMMKQKADIIAAWKPEAYKQYTDQLNDTTLKDAYSLYVVDIVRKALTEKSFQDLTEMKGKFDVNEDLENRLGHLIVGGGLVEKGMQPGSTDAKTTLNLDVFANSNVIDNVNKGRFLMQHLPGTIHMSVYVPRATGSVELFSVLGNEEYRGSMLVVRYRGFDPRKGRVQEVWNNCHMDSSEAFDKIIEYMNVTDLEGDWDLVKVHGQVAAYWHVPGPIVVATMKLEEASRALIYVETELEYTHNTGEEAQQRLEEANEKKEEALANLENAKKAEAKKAAMLLKKRTDSTEKVAVDPTHSTKVDGGPIIEGYESYGSKASGCGWFAFC